MSSRRRKSSKINKRHKKQQTKPKWQKRAKKSSKTPKSSQNSKTPPESIPVTLSIQALLLNRHLSSFFSQPPA
jgi:hypothetical protein